MPATHELCTALTSLGMSVDLLFEHAADRLSEKERDLLQIAHDEVHRLKALITDLFDLSQQRLEETKVVHMEKKSILLVDDEKNIRLTMSRSLEPLGVTIDVAVNGEEALRRLREDPFDLVFLDLKMPGIDGMEVLRQIKEAWPKTRVVIVTAHGTIESAVEAMKLGAADFIQKPFTPGEIRELATRVLDRERLDEGNAVDYPSLIELTKRYISDCCFSAARKAARKAIATDPAQPESYNLLGALLEVDDDWLSAEKFYRAALDIDPTFKPARANLERITSWDKGGGIDLGPDKDGSDSQCHSGEENFNEK